MAELVDERRAVHSALSEYDMHGWLWEKHAGARPEPVRSTYLKEVAACDLYIGLFWPGYGPYTIEEYEHARRHKKGCLIYEKYIDTDKRDPLLQAFLEEIQRVKNPDGLTVCRFETPEELGEQIQKDVMHLLISHFRETRQQPSHPPGTGNRWHAPKPPPFDKAFVGRQADLDTLIAHLFAGQDAAITGKATNAALQGMGGIGKTYLARKLGMELQKAFPGGVMWIEVGPQVSDEASAQVPLRKLASYIPDGVPPAGRLHPEQLAALIEEHTQERLLVVFDDVWHQAPLRFLARALPANAVRLVTTRYANIAQTLGGKMVRLDRLSPQDGLALLEDRLDCRGDTSYRAELEQLVALLDGHALALDIAAALIKKRPSCVRAVQMVLDHLRQGIGHGKLSNLVLPPSEERDENLEKTLALSYERMSAEQQRHFRATGVFAAEAPITVEAMGAVWDMNDLNDVQNGLFELVDLALLSEVEEKDDVSYRQHGLLRVYAYALLEKAGELAVTCRAHAQYYTDMVERTEVVEHTRLEQHIQNLLVALEWTDDNDPVLFSELLDGLRQFFLNRGRSALLETYLPKAVAAAKATGNKFREANLLQSLGDLERRLGNIDEARAHYDAALPLFQSERARLGEASVYTRLGDMFVAQEDWTQARIYYEQALPLFLAEREPIGQANTLIDLGRARFELGEHDQGMLDVQEAARLYHFIRNDGWACRAEQYLAEMRRRLEEAGGSEV